MSRTAERPAQVGTNKFERPLGEQNDNVHLNAPVPAPLPGPVVVPTITATKTDALAVDVNADTNVDPGDTIEYTITINNSGTDATNVAFSDTIDAHTTLVGGSVNTQPIADPDTYSASGNIQISLVAPGVLTNDRDPDTGNNSGLTVSKVQGVGANVGVATDTTQAGRGGVKGSVTLNGNGSFTYEPPPGFEGADTFTYEISDGTKTDTATVTINISGMVWFISNNAGGLNRGTFSNPFTSMGSFNTANAGSGAIPDPKNNDFISLRTGTGTYNEVDGINLRAQQKLIGNAVQFNTVFTASSNSSSAYTTFAGATNTAPLITTTSGNGIDLSTDNTVRGLNVGNTTGFFKINGGIVGSPIINTINLTGGGGALNVSASGAFGGNVTFGTFESTSSPAANLNLVGVTGTLGITSPGTGLSGSAAASAAVNVSGGTVSFTYTGNVSKSNAGALVSISGGHSAGTITFNTGTLSATAGTGLQFDNADGTYNFNGTNTLNGGDAGIDILNGSSGTFNFSASSTITSPSGAAFNVASSPGNPTVTYSGSITHNTAGQRAVNIDGTTGGSISINSVTAGSIAGGVGNTGVNINNANGSVTFTTLNLGTSGTRMTAQAVTIAGGSGAKNLGTVSIFTTGTAEGIHSTTTTGAITTTTGDVNSAGAAAINIAGTSAATRTPLNIQLTSLAANGGAKGLIILNTSATGSPGGFRVNGTGTTDGSGGTIQNTTTRGADIQTAESILLKNMNFTNANSSVDGGSAGSCDDLTITGCNSAIYLNGVTTLATFDNLNLTGTMVENGVTAIGVANFKFDNSLIDGAGNEVHESGIEAQNLSGTATVNSTEIRFSETDAFAVTNFDTSLTTLTISSSTFRDSQTQFSGGPVNTNGEGGFQFRSFSVAAGQPTATINVLNSSFLRLRTQAIQVFAQDDTTINLDVTGSTLDAQADIGTGFDINSDDTATFNFNILNNPTIQSRGGAAVNITSFLGSHMEGRLNNNPDIEVLGGAGIPVRLVAQETSQMIVEINGNTVSNVNGTEDTAIDVQSRFQTARVDATITNNNVTVESTGVADINLISGSSTAGESNITCGDVANNTAHGNGAARAFRVRVSDLSNTNRLFLEGFVEAGTASQDTEATWSSRGNTPTGLGEVTASLTGTAVGPLAPPGGVCLAVDTPSDFGPITARNLTAPANETPASNTPVVTETAAVQNSSPNSKQPSLIFRAVNALAAFTTGVLSLIEPTAHASGNSGPIASAVEPAERNHEKQVTTPSLASGAGTQKSVVTTSDSGSRRKIVSNHAVSSSRAFAPAMMSGETVNVNIGTLRGGDSVTITFRVTVNNPPNLTLLNPPRVRNQGTVTADGGISVLTDDTALGGATDPTDTPIDLFDTTTTLNSNLNPSDFGDQVTFTATINETPVQATADPSGTVDFIDTNHGNAVICDDVPVSGGSVQCQTSSLTAESHDIRADYSGDGNFDPSQSNIVAQVVNACTPNPVVTSTADTGAGTLREALGAVCTGDTITFDIAGAGPHTITLTTGELVVDEDVTIRNNSGESITISGNSLSRVFNINSGKTATIIGLTITGGAAASGAGILNDGTLTVVNSTLTGNSATADGGAISTSTTSLTLINTTISGNSAAGNGGGVFVAAGIANSINSTITNNTADSDNNSAGIGGGIAGNSTTTIKNTIVAGNFNEDGASDAADDISGTIDAASSFNLIGTGGSGGLVDGVNNNKVGVASPGLGALASNGGTTQTHALTPTSAALDAGGIANLPADTFDLDGDLDTAEPLPVDQRGTGFPRIIGSSVDIGSFELGQADLSIIKTDGVSSATPGTSVVYTIVVSNAGPSTATGATVADTFPAALTGVSFTSLAAGGATGNTASGSGNISDTLTMPSGSSVTYTVNATIQASTTGSLSNTATVTAPASVVDPTPGNNTATDTDTLTPQADLSITKTDGVTSAVPGGSVTYTIVVTNNGPSNANGATVTDTFPAGLTGVTFTSVAAGGATGNTASGSGNISETLNMPGGSSVTYTVNATVSPSATGSLTNTATVTAPAGVTDPTPGNNNATDTDTLTPTADLSITKTDGSATEVPGTPVTYTITVTNSGPSAVTGATVSDTFPGILSGVTFTSVAAGGATGNTASGSGNISDSLNMPSGSSVTYTVTGNIASSATGTLTNTATVTTPGGVTDPTPGNNSATDTDTLVPSADVSVTKTDTPDPVQSGNNITYTITVTNSGPSDAQSLSLSDTVPANTTFVSATAPAGWSATTPAVGGTGTVTFTAASLASGASSVFTLVVNVTAATADGTTITNTANVSSSTADPNTANNSATTTTLVSNQPGVSILDAQANEPSSGTTQMLFTVALSFPAPAGGASVHYATADQAPGVGHATAGSDYTAIPDTTLNFAAGEQFKVITVNILSGGGAGEGDETFLVNLSNPTNATISDGQAIGTIKEGNAAGAVLISELRTSGPGGAGDDFVEIYNNSDSDFTVTASDASGGYGLFKMGADCNATPVLIGAIPNGTVIPARGHYLFVGSAYSLANYGGTGAAAGDQTLSADIENDRNVAIFTTASLANISSATRLDGVGFGSNTGGVCDLFREGTTLAPLSGSTLEYSFVRDECGKKANPNIFGPCPTGGIVQDTNVNGDDFLFLDTTGAVTIAGQRLGAPGPENLASPTFRNTTFAALFLDATKGSAAPPNRVRDTSAVGPNATNGTMSIRRRFVNNTGAPVTRLRFRIVDITSLGTTGGIADLRALTSSNVTVTGIDDAGTCLATGTPTTTPCTVTVLGTTLEQPPTQTFGGAHNSTLSTGTVTLGTPLPAGASINLQFLLGVEHSGSFKFYMNIEGLSDSPSIPLTSPKKTTKFKIR
jgi:uncharacterized repeat protein (TIGR01451 family)